VSQREITITKQHEKQQQQQQNVRAAHTPNDDGTYLNNAIAPSKSNSQFSNVKLPASILQCFVVVSVAPKSSSHIKTKTKSRRKTTVLTFKVFEAKRRSRQSITNKRNSYDEI
jgi:hypothetical protein